MYRSVDVLKGFQVLFLFCFACFDSMSCILVATYVFLKQMFSDFYSTILFFTSMLPSLCLIRALFVHYLGCCTLVISVAVPFIISI